MTALVLLLLTLPAHAAPSPDPNWAACNTRDDCTELEIGCGGWTPINKKYLDQMKKNFGRPCLEPRPQAPPPPLVNCLRHACVLSGDVVRDWLSASGAKKDEAVDSRVSECDLHHLTYFAVNPNRLAELAKPSRARAREKLPKLADKEQPLKPALEKLISCPEVEARADTLGELDDPRATGNPMFNIDSSWKECGADADCEAGITDCYRWVAINEKHLLPDIIAGGRRIEGTKIVCAMHVIAPGAKPDAVCRAGLCAMAAPR